VVHPPLYHLFAAGADWMAGDAPMQTRLTWVRYVTVLFGVLAVYAAWLLAAQVFRRESHQLFVGFMVAVQPMIGFLSGIANHDSALIAFYSLAVALMLFALRTAPRAAQGAWLGGAIALALMVKGSALALLPLAGIAYLAQALTWRTQWREVLKAAGIAALVVAVIAGWWYVRSRIVYGTTTGAVSGGGGEDPGGTATLSQLLTWSKEWTALTYRTYWWHYVWWEAPARTFWYYVPALIGAGGALGLLGAIWSCRRHLFDPANPRLRQIVVMLGAVLALFISFLLVDLQRRTDGAGFYVNGGRYLLPAYAAAASLFLIGVLHLVRRSVRPLVLGALAVTAAYFSFHVFEIHYWHRYFGDVGPGELFHRMSFDRPAFVTQETLWVLFGLVVLSFAAFVVVWVRGSRTPVPATE
jgi:4-amino-4-deoxy-L-arabinose transferase-like glycosyltransferase